MTTSLETEIEESEAAPAAGAVGKSRSPAKRFVDSWFSVLFGQALGSFAPLLLVPLFVSAWGTTAYGEWLILSATVSYLGTLDLGVQSYVVNRLTQAHSRGEMDEYHQVLHSALLLSGVVCLTGLCVAGALSGLLPIGQWLNVRGPSAWAIKLSIFWLSLQVVGAIPIGIITGVYRTLGRFARGQMVSNVQKFSGIALTACLLSFHSGFVYLAAVQCVPALAVLVFTWYDLRTIAPEIRVGLRCANVTVCRSLLLPSSYFLLIQGAAALSIQGTVVLIGSILGPVSVTAFVTTRTLTNVVRSASNAARSSAWPELTSLEARGDIETVRALHSLLIRALIGAACAVGVMLEFFGKDIFSLWSHGKIAYQPHVAELLIATALIESCWGTSGLLLMATNNHRLVGISYLASSIVALGVGYALLPRLGLTGVAWGVLIGDLCVPCWVIPAIACRMVRERLWVYTARAGWTAAKVLAALSLLLVFVQKPLGTLGPLGHSVALTVTVVVASPLVGYWLVLNRGERDRVKLFLNARRRALVPSHSLSQVR